MNKSKMLVCLAVASAFLTVSAYAENITNVYVTNNIIQEPSYRASNIMCTERGGICTNGHYIMSTARTIYAPPVRNRIKSNDRQRLGLYY